CARSSNPFAYW
nr:immunoglobulin heavy chain junction region [Mus musculus]MBK4187890.1 immunoglobulin heavy chain junction region [Mus musculus]